jgi:DNA-binding transcriptional regulator YiaG
MIMRKKRSKILDAVHSTARGLRAANAIDQITMRQFDGGSSSSRRADSREGLTRTAKSTRTRR